MPSKTRSLHSSSFSLLSQSLPPSEPNDASTVHLSLGALGCPQVQCRFLADEIKDMYDECEDMARQEVNLRAEATAMEAWITRGRKGENMLFGSSVEEGNVYWENREEDQGDAKNRKAGVSDEISHSE